MSSSPTRRAKHAYRVVDERAAQDRPPMMSVSIHRGVQRRDSVTTGEPRADDLSNYKLCEPDDIVINRMRAFQGAIGISAERGLVSPDYLVVRPLAHVDGRYLHHLFRSMWFVGQMTSRLRGIGSTDQGNIRTPRINAEDLGEITILLPPVTEQQTIADYLDTETTRIDALITKKHHLSQLLGQRWRVAVEARMKELAQAHGTIQLRHLVECVDGRRIPLSAEERAGRVGPYPYYGASGIVDWVDGYLFNEQLVLLVKTEHSSATRPIRLRRWWKDGCGSTITLTPYVRRAAILSSCLFI